jgi:hypothetical protein
MGLQLLRRAKENRFFRHDPVFQGFLQKDEGGWNVAIDP